MPVRLTLDDPSRMIVGVASGTLTLPELIDFLREFLAVEKMSYRKIVDFSACEPGFDFAGLAEFIKLRSELRPPGPSGPLALVLGEHQKDFGKAFADLTGGDRPASVFRSIHDARRWIAQHSAPERS